MLDSAPGLACFKAYDIRGRVPEELDETLAYNIGRAYAAVVKPRRVVLGHDIRLTSPALQEAVGRGLRDAGVDTHDIGLCGTEEIYFATSHFGMDGGIMVTASHNPVEYNGMKFVVAESRPLTRDNGLQEMEEMLLAGTMPAPATTPGQSHSLEARPAYIEHLLGYVDTAALKPLKIVTDAGNGGAGIVLDALEPHLPFEFIKLHNAPDGRFPNGVPNPLLPENRMAMIDALRQSGADLGIAWDGDFDRCFLFDDNGGFVEGYYIVGLLAEAFLQKFPGQCIIHDPRLTWNTIDMVERAGGTPIQSKTGHAFIKEAMRRHDAPYGGEMSGHHYFRDFFFCDSGMIPWLIVTEMICHSRKSLSQLVGDRMAKFPCSGEINFTVDNPAAVLAYIEDHYAQSSPAIDRTDGLSMAFDKWRFSLRASNTEPILRLNVESRGNERLMREKTEELTRLVCGDVT